MVIYLVSTTDLVKSSQDMASLNSSSAIGGGAMVLVTQPKTAGFRPISKYKYIIAPRLSKC